MTNKEALEYAERKMDTDNYRLEMGYLNRGLYQIVAREFEFMRVASRALRAQIERERVIGVDLAAALPLTVRGVDLVDEDGNAI